MKRADVIELFSRLRELDPHPTTELVYSTPFELLVAVVLSAQATDVGVNKATARLFPVANTPRAIIDLGLDGLKENTDGVSTTLDDGVNNPWVNEIAPPVGEPPGLLESAAMRTTTANRENKAASESIDEKTRDFSTLSPEIFPIPAKSSRLSI